jgi:putative addiction module component (TIGR02574 family)
VAYKPTFVVYLTLAIMKGPQVRRRILNAMSTIDIAKLSPEERLELLEQLWDSLSPEAVLMTDAQKEELDRRLDELDREGPVGIPWNEVLDRIRNRAL